MLALFFCGGRGGVLIAMVGVVYIMALTAYLPYAPMWCLSLSAIFGGIEMELLLLIGFGLFLFGKWIYDQCTRNHHVFTGNREKVGKSTKGCQRIVKKYSK